MYKAIKCGLCTLWQYSKALYASFYSQSLYAHVFTNWRGLGVSYLLFVIILGSLPLSGRIMSALTHFFDEEVLFPIQIVPPLTVVNGEVISPNRVPQFIKNKHGEVVTVVDTTGQITTMSATYPKLTVLINKNKMMFRPPSYQQFLGLRNTSQGNPVYTQHFDPLLSGVLSGREWIASSGINKLNILMHFLVFPTVVLFYFVIFTLTLLVLSALVQLYSNLLFSLTISFRAACRLLAVAATPSLVLFFVIRSGDLAVPRIGLVYLVLVLTYLSYALHAVKKRAERRVCIS